MIVSGAVAALASEIAGVPGVVTVALGGSRAIGTALPGSDTDLGVYYDRAALDEAALGAICMRHGGEAPRPGGWGPWVDGGAWLHVDGAPVDVILRDVARVREQCDRARTGRVAWHIQPGHPLGFLDAVYAGEVAVAVPLEDADGVLAGLAALVTPYPVALRRTMLDALWQVDFELATARKGAVRGDAAYVALCLATAAMRIAHAWHAVAGVWVLNEKNVVPRVSRLDLDTHGFAESATAILAAVGATPDELAASIDRAQALPRPPSPF